MLRSKFRTVAVRRRHLALLVPLTVLLMGGCQGMRDKISTTLYNTDPPDDGGWSRDSTLLAKPPAVLYRVIRKKSDEFVFPIGLLDKGTPRILHLSKRGWALFDLQTLHSGKEVTPVQNGAAESPVKMRQGMWENASAPLDTIPPAVCNSPVAIGKVSLPSGTDIVVSNYKLPSGMKTLSEGEVTAAISQVSTLVTPTLGVTPSALTAYKRTVRQIPRVGAAPAVYVQYDDFRAVTDTSTLAQRLPRHIVIVLEKGVYSYRPSWVYNTTGRPNDRPILNLLEAMDVDGDGRAELIFGVDVRGGGSYTLIFHEYNDTWKEFWRRSPMRCDG